MSSFQEAEGGPTQFRRSSNPGLLPNRNPSQNRAYDPMMVYMCTCSSLSLALCPCMLSLSCPMSLYYVCLLYPSAFVSIFPCVSLFCFQSEDPELRAALTLGANGEPLTRYIYASTFVYLPVSLTLFLSLFRAPDSATEKQRDLLRRLNPGNVSPVYARVVVSPDMLFALLC